MDVMLATIDLTMEYAPNIIDLRNERILDTIELMHCGMPHIICFLFTLVYRCCNNIEYHFDYY
jgi:hypothetical protein